MAQKRNKPRVNLTLDQEVFQALSDLRDETDVSISSFINQTMKQAIPLIRDIIQASKLAKRNDLKAIEIMRDAVNRANLEAQQQVFNLEEITPTTKPKRDNMPVRPDRPRVPDKPRFDAPRAPDKPRK